MRKSLDTKLERILVDRGCRDFILADAKDADMAFGLAAPGLSRSAVSGGHDGKLRFKTLDQYRQQIREVIAQGLVDIVLMSVSSSEQLTIRERLFDNSPVTPAIRANDTTDIWLAGAEGCYSAVPSRPFRTASIDHAMGGCLGCRPEERRYGVDLGLYSITFNNILERDYESLIAYNEFRHEAESKRFRHFLEVFSPNVSGPQRPTDMPRFVSNQIVRTLAGIAESERPIFLKIPYYGPQAMEELVRYDSRIVVGILGGGAGTTLDAFQMLYDAKRYGARVALYGRKINHAEHQLAFIELLRAVADDMIPPVEAVRVYHGVLRQFGIAPHRSLKDDLVLTESGGAGYGNGQPAGAARKQVAISRWAGGREVEEISDVLAETPEEKLKRNLNRLRRS